jgi:hypothetical protein
VKSDSIRVAARRTKGCFNRTGQISRSYAPWGLRMSEWRHYLVIQLAPRLALAQLLNRIARDPIAVIL